MKANEKRMIAILLVVLVVAIIVFAVTKNKSNDENTVENTETKNAVSTNNTVEEFTQVQGDGTKLNTSTKLNQAKEFNGFKFENIGFKEVNGQSILLADVTNNTGKATDIVLVDLILLDKNGKEIITLGGAISALQQGEKTQFNTSVTADYVNAYDFKIVIK